ncbi:unnamed protein product [Nesidiocoris tenuis]|uniref:Uncharacterized protein n=1 Tax=Nesidiocoris tenuis TaxID=355587 RepID=A0A6H5HT26_9HEMI|nr:unnamed protein product [Nesidiocoris tenuis]
MVSKFQKVSLQLSRICRQIISSSTLTSEGNYCCNYYCCLDTFTYLSQEPQDGKALRANVGNIGENHSSFGIVIFSEGFDLPRSLLWSIYERPIHTAAFKKNHELVQERLIAFKNVRDDSRSRTSKNIRKCPITSEDHARSERLLKNPWIRVLAPLKWISSPSCLHYRFKQNIIIYTLK